MLCLLELILCCIKEIDREEINSVVKWYFIGVYDFLVWYSKKGNDLWLGIDL